MPVGLTMQDDVVSGKKVLRLDGRLDASSAPSLETKLQDILEKKNVSVALDFTKVTYLSSAGMRLLLAMTKKFQSEGGAFVLFSVPEEVMEIVKMAGFERVLHLCNNEAEAIAAL